PPPPEALGRGRRKRESAGSGAVARGRPAITRAVAVRGGTRPGRYRRSGESTWSIGALPGPAVAPGRVPHRSPRSGDAPDRPDETAFRASPGPAGRTA